MNKTKYSSEELKEFEEIIHKKLGESREELSYYKKILTKQNDSGLDNTGSNSFEDSANAAERENINQLAARQQKFVKQLEDALFRIKNGTYGICIDTGKLISKERLRVVPHTQHCIEAKLAKS